MARHTAAVAYVKRLLLRAASSLAFPTSVSNSLRQFSWGCYQYALACFLLKQAQAA